MKVGINGAVHDFSDMRVGIKGAVRQASELWIGVVIGKGGTPGTDAINWTPATNGEDGEATQFVGEMIGKVGTTNCPGGGGGDTENNRGGAASGNLATAGASYNGQLFLAGGLGNKNKPKRKYGNGGDSAKAKNKPGENGAIILTYLG